MPWIETIRTSAIDDENVAWAKVGKISVALYRVEDEYYATSALCTHGMASLAEGYLDGFTIECPLHQGTFDVRTGAPTGAPCTVPVRSLPVKVQGEMIMVEVADEEV